MDDEVSDKKKTYVCLGSDQAVISAEEYNNGLTNCGGEECTLKGHPFVEGGRCKVCGENYEKGQEHEHSKEV